MNIDKDQLYNLDIGEEIKDNKSLILRVPGGWIFGFIENKDSVGYVFVPFNVEFNTKVAKSKTGDYSQIAAKKAGQKAGKPEKN